MYIWEVEFEEQWSYDKRGEYRNNRGTGRIFTSVLNRQATNANRQPAPCGRKGIKMYSPKERNIIGRNVENAIKKRFDWIIKFSVNSDGSFHWQKVKGKDRYDLYPSMSKQQADDAIVQDIVSIIRQYLPNAQLTDYFQSGSMHYPKQAG